MKLWRWSLFLFIGALSLATNVHALSYVEWSSAPAQAEHGQVYYVEAHGWSDSGSLSQVNIWKQGSPFAFAGGGDGWNGWSGNATSDGGEQYVTFMGESVDGDGSSGYIYYTIHINAPNNPPSIAWSSNPGEAESGQYYFVEAHGWDPDGNLSSVSIWKNGVPFAFAGGGDGSNGYSGNGNYDGGEQYIEFRANAGDGRGNNSGDIYYTIHIKAPNTAPSVWWTGDAGAYRYNYYTVRANAHDDQGNMTGIHIYREGQPFAFALNGNGSDASSENPDYASGAPGSTVSYSAEAHDSYGASSGYIYYNFIVYNRGPSATWSDPAGASPKYVNTFINSPYSYTASASDQDNDLQQIRVYRYAWEDVAGNFVMRQNYELIDSVNSGGGPINHTFSQTGGKPMKWIYDYYLIAQDAAGASSDPSPYTGYMFRVELGNRTPADPTLTSTQATIGLGQSVVISSFGTDQDSNITESWLWWQGPGDGPNDWHEITPAHGTYAQGTGSSTINYTFTPSQLGTYRLKTRTNDPYISTVDIIVGIAVLDTTPPNAPTNVHVGGIYQDRVQILWDLSNSGDVTQQKIFYQPTSGGAESNILLGVNVVGYWVLYLTNATSYHFYIRAYDGAGNESPKSNEIDAITAFSATDWDGDGIPDTIENLFGTNTEVKGTTDPTNATLQLKIHKPTGNP